MNPPTYVIVPVRDQPEVTDQFLRQMEGEEHAGLIVLDNMSDDPDTLPVLDAAEDRDPRVRVVRMEGGIYHLWNTGWSLAATMAAHQHALDWNLLVANNDVRFLPGTLATLAAALRRKHHRYGMVCPDYRLPTDGGWGPEPFAVEEVKGTYRHGGIAGWFFMVRGELRRLGLPRIDERFGWWCGDDDLAFSIERFGYKLGRVAGVPLDHLGEATASSRPDLHDQKHRDMQLCIEKWGR